MEWHESTDSQVLRNLSSVERVSNLLHHLRSELLVLYEYIAIKTIWSKSLIEVGLLSCLSDVFYIESRSRIDLLICHLFILGHTLFQMLLHVIWPPVDPLEIARNDLVNLHAVFEYF